MSLPSSDPLPDDDANQYRRRAGELYDLLHTGCAANCPGLTVDDLEELMVLIKGMRAFRLEQPDSSSTRDAVRSLSDLEQEEYAQARTTIYDIFFKQISGRPSVSLEQIQFILQIAWGFHHGSITDSQEAFLRAIMGQTKPQQAKRQTAVAGAVATGC